MSKDIQRAADTIRQSDAILIAAGAGIGVDSGLPDFRGNERFWRARWIAADFKIALVVAQVLAAYFGAFQRAFSVFSETR